MAHTIYENFVLENKLEDLLTTAVDLNSYMTIDNSLTAQPGMTKKIHKYTATGDVEEQAGQWRPGSFGAHMAIFDALCRETVGTLSGKWSTVNHLEGLHHPGVGEETMYGDIALAFSGKQEQIRQIGAQWGAEPFPVGDAAFVLRIFPFLPMVFQFWEGDEEFPPQIRLLWDSNMLSFVRYETIWYIAADFLGEMKRRLCP